MPTHRTLLPDDDSDGELFIEDSHRRGAASRSPGSMAVQSSKASSGYTVNTPSVYSAPALAPPAAAAPPPPSSSSNAEAAGEALAGAIAVASGEEDVKPYGSTDGGAAASREVSAAAVETGNSGSLTAPTGGGGAEHESMSSERVIAPDSSAEVFASGTGVKGGTGLGLAGGLRLGGERMSIPRDGSTLEVRAGQATA